MLDKYEKIIHDLYYINNQQYISNKKDNYVVNLNYALEELPKLRTDKYISATEEDNEKLAKQYLDCTELINCLEKIKENIDNVQSREQGEKCYYEFKYQYQRLLKYAVFIDDQIKIGDFLWKSIQEFFVKLNDSLKKSNLYKNYIKPILLNTDEEINKFKNKTLDIYSDIELVFLDRDLSQLGYNEQSCGEILNTIPKEIKVIIFSSMGKGQSINTESKSTLESYNRERYKKTGIFYPLIYIKKNEIVNNDSINTIFSLITNTENQDLKLLIDMTGNIEIYKDNKMLGQFSLNNLKNLEIRPNWYNEDEPPYVIKTKRVIFSGKNTEEFNKIIKKSFDPTNYIIIKYPDSEENNIPSDLDEKYILVAKSKYDNDPRVIKLRNNGSINSIPIYEMEKDKKTLFIEKEIEGTNINWNEVILKGLFKQNNKVINFNNLYLKNTSGYKIGELNTSRDEFSNFLTENSNGAFIGSFFKRAGSGVSKCIIGSIEFKDNNIRETISNNILETRFKNLEDELKSLKEILQNKGIL
jgi:hypothetical protein